MKRIPSGSWFAISIENPKDFVCGKEEEEVIEKLEEKGYKFWRQEIMVYQRPTEEEIYFEKMQARALRQSPYDKWVAISLTNPKDFAYGDSLKEACEKMGKRYKEGKCVVEYNHRIDNITYAAV